MDEKLYRPEPIPRRPHRPDSGPARLSRTPMNGSRPDARDAIARIMADKRFSSTVHTTSQRGAEQRSTDGLFSNLNTGRQPFDLPERYHQMRAISRWQESTNGQPGRWLTEAELFWRQGTFMADWEDDCPYNGLFKSYFPTYNAMSDRQLRGYFTWRAAVRAGDVQETSLSFAYVYLYELINGIGAADPLDGFRKIETFWQAYCTFAPELDRYVNVWLQDYAVYHGLDPHLLEPYKTVAFDRALIALRDADAAMAEDAMFTGSRRKRGESAIPLPPDIAREKQLFTAIDALSTYRLSNSRLFKERPDALRHVVCAVYMRMSEHHRKQRKNSLLESWFGEEVELPYTMFGSAVFFEPERHADAAYQLDEIHRYRCSRGLWTCERFHGNRARNPKLGAAMRAVDRSLREVHDPEHPLKDDEKTPKYLQKFIDQEIEAWRTWSAAHAPVRIDIDLSQLASIRSAAAETREALLIDEEREGNGALVMAASKEGDTAKQPPEDNATECTAPKASAKTAPEPATPVPLSPAQAQYVQALLAGNRPKANAAAQQAKTTEDLLVDAINEALFDQIGDTVIEYGPDGNPQLIEDYREDVEGILHHE